MTSDPKVTKIFEDAANYFLKCFFTFKMFRRKSTSELVRLNQRLNRWDTFNQNDLINLYMCSCLSSFIRKKQTKKNSCIPTAYTLVAPDPIRVQSCVWYLF